MVGVVTQDSDGNFVMPGEVRYDANDALPNYVGTAAVNGTPTSANAWVIYKYTYSGSNVTRIQKLSNVAWDDRASLSW